MTLIGGAVDRRAIYSEGKQGFGHYTHAHTHAHTVQEVLHINALKKILM